MYCDAYCFQRERETSFVEVGISRGHASSVLNVLFINLGVRGMLKRSGFEAVDMMFSFLAGFVSRALEYIESAPMTRIDTKAQSF